MSIIGNLLGYGNDSREVAIAEPKEDKEDKEDIVVYQEKRRDLKERSSPRTLVVKQRPRELVQYQTKRVVIDKESYRIDAYALMQMIKKITQEIGEYKDSENPFSAYLISGLRKTRATIVQDLNTHFNIKWSLDDRGNSNFFAS